MKVIKRKKRKVEDKTNDYTITFIILVLVAIAFFSIGHFAGQRRSEQITYYAGYNAGRFETWNIVLDEIEEAVVNNKEIPDFTKCEPIVCECAKDTNVPCMLACYKCADTRENE